MKFASEFAHELHFALRALRRSPAVALTAIFALAIGIGASTAVFSVVDRILFRSLPYPHEEQLVAFGLRAPIEPREFMLGADYLDWRKAQTPFQEMAAYSAGVTDCDLSEGQPLRLSCMQIESTLLPVLGVAPMLGRNFTPDEDRPAASSVPAGPPPSTPQRSGISHDNDSGPRAALVSYALWRGRFGGDAGLVGHTISLDGHDVRIVGVLPRDFELPNLAHADVLLPLALDPAINHHPNTGRVLRNVARLKPGYTPAQAQQALQPLFQDSLRYVPPQFVHEVKLSVRTLRERQMGEARLASAVLLFAVIAVLLIACANVANLLLARAASRARERAIRTALGASRWRLAMHALAESAVLAFAGGVAGIALAFALLRLFVRVAPQGIPRLEQAGIDLRVLGFALLASAVSALLFGLAPALQRPDTEQLVGGQALRTGGGAMRNLLVAAQIAVSIVLLAGASLLLRSFWNLQAEPLGLNSEHVLTATISLGVQRYPDAEHISQFYEDLEERLHRVPGVEALSISDTLPPSGAMRSTIFSTLLVEGRPPFRRGTGGMVAWRSVTPDYFRALGISLLRGRAFTGADREPNANAMIVNQTLARRLFGDSAAVGQRVALGQGQPAPPDGRWFTVVGVAPDVKNSGVKEAAEPEFYVVRRHVPQDATARSSLVVRTALSPAAVSRWVRAEVAAIDPTLPVQVETMEQRVGKLLAEPRFNALLLGIFAAMALILAAVGLYGVMAFLVAQRTQEIGVRMALGATPGSIAKLVLSRAALWVGAGAIVGLAGALASARVLQSLLYHVPQRDPVALAASLVLLIAVALLAAFIPARRAAAVDPMVALRHD